MKHERLVAWERADEHVGHSVALVRPEGDGWTFLGTEVLAGPDELISCSFRIGLAADWTTRSASVAAFGSGLDAQLELRVDDERQWRRDGTVDPDLAGCVDIDVAATPLTNTFPIRRLSGLEPGQQVTTPIAWVDVPSLRVLRVDQTYRRLGPLRWQYSDPQHGAFVLEVDEDGLVTDYEGFARRLP